MSSSDSDKKIKVYKNRNRNNAEVYKPYMPQYQVHGKEPEEYKGTVVPNNTPIVRPTELPLDNPRAKRSSIRQSDTTAVNSNLKNIDNLVLNVGNNMEHTWSSVDAKIIDDLSNVELDLNEPMIDNNEFVTPQAMDYQNGIMADDILPPQNTHNFILEEEMEKSVSTSYNEDLLPIVADMEEDSYLLIIAGVSVCSGPMEEIQEQARGFFYGEHELCDGKQTSLDDIIILKRVKIKLGLFLE